MKNGLGELSHLTAEENELIDRASKVDADWTLRDSVFFAIIFYVNENPKFIISYHRRLGQSK